MKKVTREKKEITMNDLAVMIAKVDKKTDGLAVMIAKVDKKTDGLAIMIAEGVKKTDDLTTLVDNLAIMTSKRFDGVEDRLEKVESRLEKVENEVVATKLSTLNLSDRSIQRYEFDDLRVRFNRLEQKVDKKQESNNN